MSREITHTSEGRPHQAVTVRLADSGDTHALLRLSTLDSTSPPAGPMLLAESDGQLMAAVPVAGGRAIADPFSRTAPLVEMLELRAAQLRAQTPGEEKPTSWRGRLTGLLRDSRPVPHLP